MSQAPFPLQAIPLGVGDMFSQVNYTTTFLVMGGRTRILIDCPSPLRKILHEAAAQAGIQAASEDIDAILLTHLHGDHCNGIEEFGFHRKIFATESPTPILYVLPEVRERLWNARLAGPMERSYMPSAGIDSTNTLDDFFDARGVEPGQPFFAGDLEIQIRRTQHPLPCYGCKIYYGGRILGYSCDTDFDPEHIEFLSESDLIFHECNEGIHTPYADLAQLPESIRRKMRLVHLPDGFDSESSIIEPAEAGKVYVV